MRDLGNNVIISTNCLEKMVGIYFACGNLVLSV